MRMQASALDRETARLTRRATATMAVSASDSLLEDGSVTQKFEYYDILTVFMSQSHS